MKHRDIRTKELPKMQKGTNLIMNFCKFLSSEALSAFHTDKDPIPKEPINADPCGPGSATP